MIRNAPMSARSSIASGGASAKPAAANYIFVTARSDGMKLTGRRGGGLGGALGTEGEIGETPSPHG